MPRELVQIQVGQCGNQLGTRLLDLYLHEHLNALMTSNNKNNTSAAQSKSIVSGNRSSTIDPSALESLQTVFQLYSPQSHYNNSSSNRLSNFNSFQNIDDVKQAMCARTVAVDMEEGVLKAMMSGPLAPYLRSCHRISDVSGAGNNWAVGHMEYGDRHGETIVESVRKTVEACDSIQAFMLMHSLSGGTGSGLGTRILGLLEEEFPDVARFAMVVLPSISSPSDVVVAPYNTCFALRELVEHADCILPLDNDALAKAVDKASGADRVRGGHEATSSSSNRYNSNNNTDYNAANPTQTGKLPFDDMNAVAAQMFSNLTCGVRFPGQLNLDISDIVTNMVPFPRLQFLVPSISPLSAKHRFSGTNPGRVVDQMFSSVLDTDHTLVECDYQAGTTLCSAFVCRGSDVDVGDVSRNIPRIKERMRRIWWNENGVKTAVCSQPPVGFTRSMMALQNNTAMGERIDASRSSFVKLYTAKSHVHHFREYLEPAYFDDTMAILGDVVTQYRALNENWNNNNHNHQQFSSATSSSVYGNGTNGGTSSLRDMLRERQRQQQMQSF